MKKDIKSTDKISEGTLHEILLDIKYRLDHLEDIEADNRALIVKMIRQGNSIVKFLSQIDIEPVDNPFEDIELPPIKEDKSINIGSLPAVLLGGGGLGAEPPPQGKESMFLFWKSIR